MRSKTVRKSKTDFSNLHVNMNNKQTLEGEIHIFLGRKRKDKDIVQNSTME